MSDRGTYGPHSEESKKPEAKEPEKPYKIELLSKGESLVAKDLEETSTLTLTINGKVVYPKSPSVA